MTSSRAAYLLNRLMRRRWRPRLQKGVLRNTSTMLAARPLTGHAFAEADDVGVVVGAGVGGVEFGGAERRADAGNAVGGHAHADAGAAHENANAFSSLRRASVTARALSG